jgi:hypothetical protein
MIFNNKIKNNWHDDNYMGALFYEQKNNLIYSLLNKANINKWRQLSYHAKNNIFNINDDILKNNFNTILNYHNLISKNL